MVDGFIFDGQTIKQGQGYSYFTEDSLCDTVRGPSNLPLELYRQPAIIWR